MKFRVLLTLLALLSLLLPTLAQDRVLAQSGGYQLNQSHLDPALELLEFLTQQQLTVPERQEIVRESVVEFQEGPQELLQSMQELAGALHLVKSKNDPMILGEFRQQMLGEFHKLSQETPEYETPAYMRILNEKAPVIAYDPNTNVALTKPDLVAALVYMKKLGDIQGQNFTEQDLLDAAEEAITTFDQIDPDMQKMLASGTLLESLFSNNMNQMTTQQKSNTTSHYRQTVGGPPSGRAVTRGEETKRSAYERLSVTGPEQHQAMMKSVESAGGKTDYWAAVKKF